MDVPVQNLFKKHETFILQEAARRYGFAADCLRRLGSFESFVYEYDRNGSEYILRVTDSTHRTVSLLQGELHWVNYLADHGVSVPRAIKSNDGNLVEAVELPENMDIYFSLVAFTKAHGCRCTFDDWSNEFLQEWGRVTGRMHALAQGYEPPDESWRRPHWDEDVAEKAAMQLPESEKRVMQKFRDQIDRLRALPTDGDAYGLTHVDFHHGNFFVNDGKITVFDFDDSQYDWYVNDIAMPLFYAAQDPQAKVDPPAFARRFLNGFLAGYFRETNLDRKWLMHIPDFLKLREIDLYLSILNANAQNHSPWVQDFLRGRRENIENDVPVIDLDFGGFC